MSSGRKIQTRPATADEDKGRMNPEEIKELKSLIEFLKQNDVGEFDLERGELKVRLKFASAVAAPAAPSLDMGQLSQLLAVSSAQHAAPPAASAPAVIPPAPPAASQAKAATAADDEAGLHVVKSPIVGTFYESSAPGAQAFVKVGDQIDNGQVVCIVEAMKLMNEIESDVTGEIVKRFVTNGQPVEYGQQLFAVRPR